MLMMRMVVIPRGEEESEMDGDFGTIQRPPGPAPLLLNGSQKLGWSFIENANIFLERKHFTESSFCGPSLTFGRKR